MGVMIVKTTQSSPSTTVSKPMIVTFFGGTLLSSIGSFAFTTGAMAFMIKAGYPLTYVGFWVGTCRLMGVVSTLFFGDVTDRYPARKFLIFTEIAALALSIGLLPLWRGGPDQFFGFFALSLLRAAILPLQQGARSKISKSIAGHEFTRNLATAIWLNKATQGATVFSALICLYAVKALTFESLIIFDGITFLISTLLLLGLPDKITASSVAPQTASVFNKLKDFYRYNPKAAALDFLLALVFTGVNLTVVRLAGVEKDMIPLLVAIGGFCLWLAGPIASHRSFENYHGALWLLFALSWVAFGIGSDHWSFAVLLIPFVIQRLCFFALNHRYSGMIQHDTPHEKVGSVVNARGFQATVLLSLGDLAVGIAGSLGSSIPLSIESIWRVVVSLGVAVTLLFGIKPPIRRRFTAKGAAIVMAIVMTFGPGMGSKTALAKSSSVLRIPMRSLNLVLDPQTMTDAYSMLVNVQIYRGLFRFTSDSDVEPDLVEKWTVSKDHREYRFKLRERKFSDGGPVTAENVRQTFARMFFMGAAMGADLNYIAGVSEFRKSLRLSELGIVPVSTREIIFKLQSPSPLFLKQLAVPDCGILAIKDFRDKLPEKPISSGPFEIRSQSASEMLLSLRSDQELSAELKVPSQVKLILADDIAAVELAKKNEIDSLDSTSVFDLKQIKSLEAKGWHRTVTDISTQHYVLINPNLYSPEIRNFMAASLNQEELVKRLGVIGIRAAYGLIPDGLAGSITFDQAPKKVEAPEIPPKAVVQLQYIDGDPFEKSIAEELKRQWSRGAFEVVLEPVPIANLLNLARTKSVKVVLGRKGIDYPDGFAMLGYFRTGFDGNHYFWGSKSTDRKLDILAGIYEPEERAKLYREIQVEIMKSHTFLPVFFGTKMAGLWSPQVKRVPPHPMGLHMLGLETIEMNFCR